MNRRVVLRGIAASLLFLGFAGTPARAGLLAGSARPTVAAQLSFLDPEKKTICFATINSSDEKETFESRLPPNRFNMVELVTPTKENPDWFGSACKSGVKCDALVISGHFGGTFFGKSGQSLSLANLESHSCARDCEGILKNPGEVYLFGCNTLAGRDKDHRTQAEYVEVLVADGFLRLEAETIAEARYGTFGQDNESRMRRVFEGVPYLYGFKSVGPSGKNVRPLLERYLAALGDYYDRLAGILSDLHANATEKPNGIWSSSLKETTHAQCRGLDPQDPAYAKHAKICELLDPTRALDVRLKNAEAMLRSPDALALLPTVQAFFTQNLASIRLAYPEALARIQGDVDLRGRFLKIFRGIRAPVLRVDWLRFAYTLKWIEAAELNRDFESLMIELLKGPVTRGNADAACSVLGTIESSLDRLDLDRIARAWRPEHFRSEPGAQILFCTGANRSLVGRRKLNALLENWQGLPSDTLLYAVALLAVDDRKLVPAESLNRDLFRKALTICRARGTRFRYEVCSGGLYGVAWDSDEAAREVLRIATAKELNEENREAAKGAFLKFETRDPSLELAKVAMFAAAKPDRYWAMMYYLIQAPFRTDEAVRRYLELVPTLRSAKGSSVTDSQFLSVIDLSRLAPKTLATVADFFLADPAKAAEQLGFLGIELSLSSGRTPDPAYRSLPTHALTGFIWNDRVKTAIARLLQDAKFIALAAENPVLIRSLAEAFRNIRGYTHASDAAVALAEKSMSERMATWPNQTEAMKTTAIEMLGLDDVETGGAVAYLEASAPLSPAIRAALSARLENGLAIGRENAARLRRLVIPPVGAL